MNDKVKIRSDVNVKMKHKQTVHIKVAKINVPGCTCVLYILYIRYKERHTLELGFVTKT